MTAAVRGCLNAQSEVSYEMRSSAVVKSTAAGTLGEELSCGAAACEHSLRGLSRARGLCSEGTSVLRATLRCLFQVETAVARTLLALADAVKPFCRLQSYLQACISL